MSIIKKKARRYQDEKIVMFVSRPEFLFYRMHDYSTASSAKDKKSHYKKTQGPSEKAP